ncbi:hypothetical protein LAV60_07335 [Clostridium sporogenes]|uniref:Uncharacterized protein n=2 Tax=Clostridium TaxID=1485 RepID=A0A0D1A1T2_CLOBO|nr:MULTISPECIES: hypothetical protein [Clostridium]MBE6078706.1 hypothetical protein [Clostridium lundense]MDU2832712.1 hypothetical protein [Clostridium botulinum]KIS24803.1 hypothetical protein N495_14900 [Clostridium botulinum B2 450]MCW6092987.1 hypothetical protein [Clostridium sporogenes]MDU4546132.1 hypothetical protein [Clostridium botulinum]
MFLNNTNRNSEKDNIKIIQIDNTRVVKNIVHMPELLMLTNDDNKRKRVVYIYNKNLYNKIIQSDSTRIVKSTVQMPAPFLLDNEDRKRERSVYIYNKNLYSIKNFLNKATCYVNNNDKGMLFFKKLNIKYVEVSTYVHKNVNKEVVIKNNNIMIKNINNKIVAKDNNIVIKSSDIMIKYYVPYSGNILKCNEEKTNAEGKIKDFRIVAQKYSYIEYHLGFDKNIIEDIKGLPQGMIFDKKCLKGTPMISGDYLINIKLNNGTIVKGILKVPRLPRQL